MQAIPMKNYYEIQDSFKWPETALVYGALYAVDTFFWLSGLLMAYLFVRELQAKDGKVPWGMVYFHRFWRILPLYMFALFTSWAYLKYLGDSPLWW
jgi:peptidoglycan/LPS O-acetylase OafA/YrhL